MIIIMGSLFSSRTERLGNCGPVAVNLTYLFSFDHHSSQKGNFSPDSPNFMLNSFFKAWKYPNTLHYLDNSNYYYEQWAIKYSVEISLCSKSMYNIIYLVALSWILLDVLCSLSNRLLFPCVILLLLKVQN